jgi:excinuclease ABC subunit A
MSHDWIAIRGARVHNLKNVDVDLPRNRLVVITGLSGSGKSSLAFDTIYAEGQRRYVESLSAYARQFLEQMEKPDVDLIDGLSPAISIEQKTTGSNPRSTVGTVTEIYDYLRLLFANVGVPHCPSCGREISSQSLERIVDLVMQQPTEERINVLAPVVRGRKGEFKRELAALRARGFTRARVDGQFVALDTDVQLDRRRNHTIDVLVDRLIVKPGIERRLADSIDLALRTAEDVVLINTLQGGDRLFSRRMACPSCGISIPEMSPRAFSFNSPHGACPECQGLGAIYDFDPARIVPDDTLSLGAGAVGPWAKGDRASIEEMLRGLQQAFGIDPGVPFGKLPKKLRDIVLGGAPGRRSSPAGARARAPKDPFGADFEGVIPNLRRRFDEGTWTDQEALEPYRALQPCSACGGSRLRSESRAVRVKDHRLADFVDVPVSDALPLVEALQLTEREQAIAGRVVREIRDRLRFLLDVGVGYLTLGRGAATLSGGEGQRIRLATQIGSQLTGVLYVLDEPSIGLHQRDNRASGHARQAAQSGNTVLVVEPTGDVRTADYLVDLGRRREHGGHVMFQGLPPQLISAPGESLTASTWPACGVATPGPALARSRRLSCGARGPTTSRTSTSRFRSARSSRLPASAAPASPRS